MRQVITVRNHFTRILFEPFSTTNMQIDRLASERKILDDALLGKTFTFIAPEAFGGICRSSKNRCTSLSDSSVCTNSKYQNSRILPPVTTTSTDPLSPLFAFP